MILIEFRENDYLPSKRGLRLQQFHPIFLTINVSNKSGHLLFAPQSMEKTGFLHSYCTAPVGARTSASGAGDLEIRTEEGRLLEPFSFLNHQ